MSDVRGGTNTSGFVRTYGWLLSLVPLAGLALGILQFFRTRKRASWGKIKTLCLYNPHTKQEGGRIVQTGPAWLVVEAVNLGPGEVTIRALKGRYSDKVVRNITLQPKDLKRRQGDHIKKAITPLDQLGGPYDGLYTEDGCALVDMWFEDTFGRKHKLKRVKKYLSEIRVLT